MYSVELNLDNTALFTCFATVDNTLKDNNSLEFESNIFEDCP